jgi:hypothetical protein
MLSRPRQPFQFALADLFWLTASVAVLAAWVSGGALLIAAASVASAALLGAVLLAYARTVGELTRPNHDSPREQSARRWSRGWIWAAAVGLVMLSWTMIEAAISVLLNM